MKKSTIILNILAAMGSIVIVAIVLLSILGFRLLIPSAAVEPSWNAWQTVSTILLSMATLFLTLYIAKRQENLAKEQDELSARQEILKSETENKRFQIEQDIALKELRAKELELKISLYDKRYRVYECFNKYHFDAIEKSAVAGKKNAMLVCGENLNGPAATAFLIFNSNFISGRHKTLQELRTLTSAEQSRKDILNQQIYSENFEFWRSEIAIIEQAEFCFNSTEAQMLIDFVKSMFKYATIETFQDGTMFEKAQKELLKAIEDIKSNCVVDKIKSCLYLSYNEIGKQE